MGEEVLGQHPLSHQGLVFVVRRVARRWWLRPGEHQPRVHAQPRGQSHAHARWRAARVGNAHHGVLEAQVARPGVSHGASFLVTHRGHPLLRVELREGACGRRATSRHHPGFLEVLSVLGLRRGRHHIGSPLFLRHLGLGSRDPWPLVGEGEGHAVQAKRTAGRRLLLLLVRGERPQHLLLQLLLLLLLLLLLKPLLLQELLLLHQLGGLVERLEERAALRQGRGLRGHRALLGHDRVRVGRVMRHLHVGRHPNLWLLPLVLGRHRATHMVGSGMAVGPWFAGRSLLLLLLLLLLLGDAGRQMDWLLRRVGLWRHDIGIRHNLNHLES